MPVLVDEENERFVLQAAPGRFRLDLQGEHESGVRQRRLWVNSLITPLKRLGRWLGSG
jgi:hypothetical protein